MMQDAPRLLHVSSFKKYCYNIIVKKKKNSVRKGWNWMKKCRLLCHEHVCVGFLTENSKNSFAISLEKIPKLKFIIRDYVPKLLSKILRISILGKFSFLNKDFDLLNVNAPLGTHKYSLKWHVIKRKFFRVNEVQISSYANIPCLFTGFSFLENQNCQIDQNLKF